jgi:hypothetical protein
MTGRSRLPGGEPRKASQRNKRNVSSSGAAKITPTWQPGARVHWKDRVGTFRRDLGDGEHAEIVIEQRVYLVRIGELVDPQLMSGAVIRRTRPT